MAPVDCRMMHIEYEPLHRGHAFQFPEILMNVLVMNCGSSSLKYQVIDLETEQTLIAGTISRIGINGTEHTRESAGTKHTAPVQTADHVAGVALALKTIAEDSRGSVKTTDLAAVAHRVVHGGEKYLGPTIIDDEVKNEIRRLIPLMPLHHPAILAGIEACQKALPGIPHVAVFDTSFHGTIPREAAAYGLPYELYQKGIRKFGFHGNSHEYVAGKAAEFLETPLHRLNIITCHLGNGCSACAIERGRSIDTSMGFGPMPGLIMGTRVGDLDPGIIGYLVNNEGYTLEQVDDLLNRKSGLLGLSGISPDMREVLAAAEAGDPRAVMAVKIFCYRVKFYIGAYAAAMGGLDAIVFTGGIGQNSRGIRARSVQGLDRLGISVDPLKNERCALDAAMPVVRHQRNALARFHTRGRNERGAHDRAPVRTGHRLLQGRAPHNHGHRPQAHPRVNIGPPCAPVPGRRGCALRQGTSTHREIAALHRQRIRLRGDGESYRQARQG